MTWLQDAGIVYKGLYVYRKMCGPPPEVKTFRLRWINPLAKVFLKQNP